MYSDDGQYSRPNTIAPLQTSEELVDSISMNSSNTAEHDCLRRQLPMKVRTKRVASSSSNTGKLVNVASSKVAVLVGE